jgi:aminopeptidase N
MKFAIAMAAALLAVSSSSLAAPTRHKPAAAKIAPHVALPADVRPERYDIAITPNAKDLTFLGHEAVVITVKRATNRIVLNAADITFGKVTISCRDELPKVVVDKDQQTAAFVFDKPIAPGRYTLGIDYAGTIYQQASGFFALDYVGEHGKERALYTQFENSDARRFAPLWDEPAAKAVFALSVDTPEGQMAVSNMPVSDVLTVAPRDGRPGRRITRFADTPKMSSYLLFLALGDFERVHAMVGKTDVGVVVRRGKTDQAQFSLKAATELLPYFNDYFGAPYPLPKLDFIAGPGRSQFFAAMENWGAIYYFDYALLVDPKLTTEADKQGIYIDIAHEMAHQWFGDLVTMAWWDDLWLNEGFASWMENKATDHFHPEWKVWLQTKGGEQQAMRTDARSGTHPVITPIKDVFAAANAFDGITYEKGHAVIQMLETYVGDDAFRAGVRNYIAHHAYGNTVTDDLWREIDAVSPKKIMGIAHDFTLQSGVPLISIDSPAGKGVRVSQGRFGADAASKAPRSWRTPVTVWNVGEPWKVMVSAGHPALAPDAVTRNGPLLNAGQTGYFRSAYSPELWQAVVGIFERLNPEDQLGLIYDSRALGEAGYAPLTDFLALAKTAQDAADPVVARALVLQLEDIDDLYKGLPGQAAFRVFARARLAPAFARVGWDAKPGESDNVAILRRSLITGLSEFDDPGVIAEARRRFAAYLVQPDSLRGTNRQTVLAIVAAHADAATWDQLHTLAQQATDITDKTRLYRYLGTSHDPALADRALALSLTKDPSPTDAPELITAVGGVFADKAYDFIIAHRAQVDPLIEPASRTSYFAGVADGSADPAMLTKLAAYAATVPASTRGEVDKAVAEIRFRQAVTRERLPEADRWLAANPG